jgi:hypothetical protein
MSKIIRMFYAPSGVFKQLKEKPKVAAAFWLLVLFMVCYMAVFRTMVPYETRLKAVFEVQEAQGINIPEDVKKEMLEKGESIYIVILTYLSLPLGAVTLFFIVALFIQFFSYFVSGKSVTVKESFAISIYGGLPPIITTLVIVMLMMALLPEKIDTIRPDRTFMANLSLLVDRTSNPLLYNLLAGFDFFLVWRTILTVIGVNVMSEIKEGGKNKPLLLGISIFFIFVLFTFIISLITG